MPTGRKRRCAGLWAFLGLLAGTGSAPRAEDWAARFRDPPPQARMTAYWAWFGPALTRESIDRDLRHMHDAFIGGVTILPVYPLSVDDTRHGVRNTPFLSSEFLDLLRYAARRARDLGMTVDVTLGTGWPYGGPWITPPLGARKLRRQKAGLPLRADESVLVRTGDLVIVSAHTRMQVKRASLGGEGLVLDPCNPAALRRHLDAAGQKLAVTLRETGVRAFWCDSLEVFDCNWTEPFPEHFRRRRGYDILPDLPLLFGKATPRGRQVRRDYWRTLGEVAAEEFYRPLQQWCHDQGVLLRAEPYGQPPVSLAACRYVDLPVGEHYEWRMLNATRWAASGGHLFGKGLIDAEAWTWVGIPNRFADSLADLKLASDMHFVSGANSLMAVSYVNAPPGADRAYWVSYWGPWLNEGQPWWPYFPLLARYIQRVSWVLRQGRPVAEVALYLGVDDVFAATPADQGLNLYFDVRERLHGGPIPEFGLKSAMTGDTPVVSTLVNNGYGFDCLDSTTLGGASIGGGRLHMGLGDYALVVLPGLVGMPLADLQRLASFVQSGGILLATRRLPELAYGKDPEDTKRLRRLVAELFAPGRYGKGTAVLVPDERERFRQALRTALPPDLHLDCTDPDIGFVHRQLAEGDLYFVVNFGKGPKSLPVHFASRGAVIEVLDPMTGEAQPGWDGWLHLDPFGSLVVRLQRGPVRVGSPVRWREAESLALRGPWVLQVPRASRIEMAHPRPWTDWEALRHFSGTATYATSFEVKAPAPERRWVLDLGEAREVADVQVNGRSAGVAWKHPYRIDITRLVRAGPNTLQVKVTNLLINEVLGRTQPDYSVVHARFGQRFPDPAEWKEAHPVRSGLQGPVRLISLQQADRLPSRRANTSPKR